MKDGIEVRRAAAEDESPVKALWAYCFERPGDPFFDWYFEKVYRPCEVLVGEAGGRVACDLHLRPYTIAVRGKQADTDYIVGVATHPAARGRGYAKALLTEAFRQSRAAGKAIDILMPSDGSFYAPEGFAYYAHHWEREAAPAYLARLGERPARATTLSGSAGWTVLDRIYRAYTAGRHGYTVRNGLSWERRMEGQLKEGYIAVVYDEAGPAGYLFYSMADRKMAVSEMAFSSERGRRGLYAYMAGHMGSVDSCVWQEAEDDRSYLYWPGGAEHTYIRNRTFPYMMARLTDTAAAFDGCAADPSLAGSCVIHVEDPALPEETGNYRLSAAGGHLFAARTEEEAAVSMGTGAAAQLLLGALSIDSLMAYEKAVLLPGGDAGAPAFLRAALPPMRNWINEWY